jgi:hypothetical protein
MKKGPSPAQAQDTKLLASIKMLEMPDIARFGLPTGTYFLSAIL